MNAAEGQKIPFGVKTDSGIIFLKERLDFEMQNLYHLLLTVTDGLYNATTSVIIHVEDVNDNAPSFNLPSYSTTIEENSQIPKKIFTVKASDLDKEETNGQIIYELEGQGAEYFSIDSISGEIFVTKFVDREIMPIFKFILQAIDEDGHGLIGTADMTVHVKDQNDNAPVFPSLMFGSVDENREPSKDGIYVMSCLAFDADDPTTPNAQLEYSIAVNKEIEGFPVFRIDKTNGKLFSMRKFDREKLSERLFMIEIRATDKGFPSLEGAANVTIKITDINDSPPFFEKSFYETWIPETSAVGAAVWSFAAFDNDNEASFVEILIFDE